MRIHRFFLICLVSIFALGCSSTSSITETAVSPTPLPPQPGTPASSLPSADDTLSVAFVKNGDIHLWNATANQSETIFTAGDVIALTMSEDGQAIAFVRRTMVQQSENDWFEQSALWAVDINGENPRELVSAETLRQQLNASENDSTNIAQMQWIPHSHHLIYSGTKYFVQAEGESHALPEGIFKVNTDTGAMTELAPAGVQQRFVPSPDGRQIASMSTTSLTFFSADGSQKRQDVLTYPETGVPIPLIPYGVWTQAGNAFLIVAPIESESPFELNFTIWQVRLDGSPPKALATVTDDSHPDSVTFAPDGGKAAYYRWPDPAWLVTSLTESTGPLALSYTIETGWANLHWSPDGTAFAFPETFTGSLLQLCPDAADYSGACGEPIDLDGLIIAGLQWIDSSRFLLLTREPAALYLGTLEGKLTPIVSWLPEEAPDLRSFSATYHPMATPGPTSVPLPTLPTATADPQALSLENAASLAQIGQFTHGTINDMKWSPDGTLFAVASSIGVQLYDTTSWTIRQTLDTQAVVSTVYFLPQSNLIAVMVCQEITCQPQFWDSGSAQMVKALPHFLSMSPIFLDGHFIAVEQIDFETVRLHWFDQSGAELPQTVDLPQFPLAYSPDGATLVMASGENELQVVNLGDGTMLTPISTPGSPLSVTYSQDGRLLAIGNGLGNTQVWRVTNGELLHTLESSGIGTAFSPDGRLLATAGENSTIQLWDTASGQLLDTQKGGPRLAFSPDGSELAAAHMGSISFFPLADFELLRSVGEYGQPVEGIAISPDGHTLAAATTSEVQIWDIPSQKLHETIIYSDTSFTGVAFSPDGRILALAGSPPTNLRLWHLDNRELTAEVKDQTTYINSVAFSPDGQLVATADGDQTVKVWDAASLELLFTTPGAEFAFHPNGRILAVASFANAASGEWQVEIWDLTTLERLHTLAQVGPQIAFGADGRLLAARCCFDLGVWDIETGQMIRLIPGLGALAAISPNNQLLVHADYSHALTVWNLETGERLVDLPGHTAGFSDRSSACCIVFSPDGRFFASGSWDGTIRLWGLAADAP